MTKRKTVRTNLIDPAVSGALTSRERQSKLARMPKTKRNKAKRDAKRNRLYFDAPLHIKEVLQKEADQEEVSMSSLAAFLLVDGLKRYRNGEIDLEPHKRDINSLRFKYGLTLKEIPD